ncbi:MAG: hypothetical protein CK424_06995 [Legionella sp.]|nr:MAG: hypothetical protein CK424_06995 [Legionella sp.]
MINHQAPIIRKTDYIILKNVLRDEYCQILTNYAKFKAKAHPNIKKNIDPLDHVHREYGDPLMELLLEQLHPLMEQAVGHPLWPTLSFYYVYTKGNQLQKHKDRSSCEWVASLCIGADEDFKKTHKTWPLVLKVGEHSEEIALEYGDILLFKGHETEHWREQLSGDWFVSAIFGYVEQNGPFAFQKYDQRQTLGRPHIGMFWWAWGCLKQKIVR